MIKNLKHIEVFFEERLLGRLALLADNRCVFEYAAEWIETGFSISPFYLPLQGGVFTAKRDPFAGNFGVFNDSLPDGWGKLLVDRWLVENGIKPATLSVLERLSLVGDNGTGALIYKPIQNNQSEIVTNSLDFYALEVEKILLNETVTDLNELVNIAGSSGGARPKILIQLEGVDWLIKFRASNDPAEVGLIEYQHSLLARQCGIEMPETRLFDGKYFGVQRFDRLGKKRIHLHSAAGLLYASHRFPSLDYLELSKATLALTRNSREVEKLFRQMIFNVLIGNKDDHAKNFSFLYQNDKWQLSPAYDLLPSDGFNNNHTTTILGKGKPSIDDCCKLAREVSMPDKTAKRIIDEVIDGLGKK